MILDSIRNRDDRRDDVGRTPSRPHSPRPRGASAKAAVRLPDAKAPRTWPDPEGSGPFSSCARRRPVRMAAPRVLHLRVPTPPTPPERFDTSAKGRARAKRYRAWIQEAGWLVRAQRIGRISGPVTLEIAIKRRAGADLTDRIRAVAELLVRMGVIDDGEHVVRVTAQWSDEIRGAAVTVTRAP